MTGVSRKNINEILTTEGLDALLVFGLPNIRYLCGFTGTDGVLCICGNETVFLTDSRYLEQAQEQVNADRVVCYKNKLHGISALTKELALQRTGFEAGAVNVPFYQELLGISETLTWFPLNKQLESLRAIKTEEELVYLKQAAALNEQAFRQLLPQVKVGMTERELALELEFELKRLGGEENAFDFIVASGVRGALPHGVASDKQLTSGELVTIDFGTRVNGYHSDETVTFALGIVDRKLRQIFDIVLEAHDSAIKAVKAEFPLPIWMLSPGI